MSKTPAQKAKFWVLVAFFGIFVLYTLFELSKVIWGPSLKIETPANGALLSESAYTLTGTAKNVSFISVNDRQIYINKDNRFTEKLIALPGYNIIKVVVRDRFNKEKEEKIEFYYDADEESLPPETPAIEDETNASSSLPLIES